MDNTKEIFTDIISLPKDNMREHIDREEIYELANDIKTNGLISPITVRPVGDKYELVAGQRRYLAHQVAGILKIKCIVRELTDEQALAIMTSENLARVDVNPLDEAKHIARIMTQQNGDIKKVSQIVHRSEKWVRDRIIIGSMPDYMQDMLGKKEIKLGVALALVQITDEPTRRMWTFQAVRDGASVELAEAWLYNFRRELLPGGAFAEGGSGEITLAPPSVIMATCAIDGKNYDVRLFKTLMIYEGNIPFFNEFVSALRSPTAETEFSAGGD